MGIRIGSIGLLLAMLALCAETPATAEFPSSGDRSGLSSPSVRRVVFRQPQPQPHGHGTALQQQSAQDKPANRAIDPIPEAGSSKKSRQQGDCPGCARHGESLRVRRGPLAQYRQSHGPILPGFFGPHDQRYVGPGDPLQSGSWLNRPFSFGVFSGVLVGDTLLASNVDQHVDMVNGLRLGWDANHFWGTEMRIAFAQPELENLVSTTALGTGDANFWDINALYYPWGDSRWRPYFSVGLGLAHFKFKDSTGKLYRQDLFDLPIGIGIKRRVNPWLVLRADFTDNIGLFNSDVGTMHNFSFIFSTEIRFGGDRVNYWPWIPN